MSCHAQLAHLVDETAAFELTPPWQRDPRVSEMLAMRLLGQGSRETSGMMSRSRYAQRRSSPWS